MRYSLALGAVLLASLLAGCGSTDDATTAGDTSDALGDLQLTDDPPKDLTEACEKVASRTRLMVACPPVAPEGDFTVQVLSPDASETDAPFYDVQAESASLHRDDGERQNPGHWSFGAATSTGALERALEVDPTYVRDCERSSKRRGEDRQTCEPQVSTLTVDETTVEQFVMPAYPLGGINGGHLVFVWRGADAAYLLSVHDRANRERTLAMLDGLISETT